MEGQLGQADHDVPLVLTSLVPQPIHRGVDVFTTGGERLAHDLDVPRVAILTAWWVEVADLARNRSGRGWVSHQADADRLHSGLLPTTTAPKHPAGCANGDLARLRASAPDVSCASHGVRVRCVPVESCLRVRHAHTRWCERGGHAPTAFSRWRNCHPFARARSRQGQRPHRVHDLRVRQAHAHHTERTRTRIPTSSQAAAM